MRRYLLAATFLAGVMAFTLPAKADSSLYGGLISDGGSGGAAPYTSDGGSQGQIVAPYTSDGGNQPDNIPQEGYGGVVSGPNGGASEEQINRNIGGEADQADPPPSTVMASVESLAKDMKANNYGIKPPPTDFHTAKSVFIEGKSGTVYAVDQDIKHVMTLVNDPTLSKEERSTAAKQGYLDLSTLADGLRVNQSIPDHIYKQMKLTDQFIQDERNGNEQALAELDAALTRLKGIAE
jgi:hypothetical protein